MKKFTKKYLSIIAGLTAVLALFNIQSNFFIGALISLFLFVSIGGYILLNTFNKSIAGIIEFYSQRNNLSGKWWEDFFCDRKTPKEIIFMSQCAHGAFKNKKQLEAFIKYCKEGSKFYILLLSPNNIELDQHYFVSQGMSKPDSEKYSRDILRTKIYDSISMIKTKLSSQLENDKKPLLRFATINLPYSMIVIDNEMILTFYGSEAEANKQPTIKIIKEKNNGAYNSFRKEFDTIWGNYSKISPYEDPIIKIFKKEWQNIMVLRNHDKTPPPPLQAIIYPTYKCSKVCSFCLYKNFIESDEEYAFNDLESLLNQLVDYNVRKIEISGGGEPLEYSYFSELLILLNSLKEKHHDIKYGLLTNGSFLGKYNNNILHSFNDYIRISRYQHLEKNNQGSINWQKNVKNLIELKSKLTLNETKIGIKYLLTKENYKFFYEMVKSDYDSQLFNGIDHLRFRSTRDVDTFITTEIEQKIYNLFQEKQYTNYDEIVSLSLNNIYYPENFKCWISPLNVVIDPYMKVYVCSNYINDDNKLIGQLNNENSFKDIWESKKHLDKRRRLEANNCSRSIYSNCRFAEIQDMYERNISFLTETNINNN